MLKGPSADFDGDHLSGNPLTMGEVANFNVRELRDAKTLEDQIELMFSLTEINKSKFRNMSRRRKKIVIQEYSSFSGHYNVNTGLLVSNKRRHEKCVKTIPLILRCEERIGKPLDDFFNAWALIP